MKITDIEYEKLVRRLEFNDTMRNNLLTFSFTAVLAILGIALQMELDAVSAWICLLPYLLIIPFGAFLRTYAKDRVMYEIGAKDAGEEKGIGKMYKQIAFLVNHEMVLLGIASSLVFYLKFIPQTDSRLWWNYIGYITPVTLIIWVFCISHSTNKYNRIVSQYTEWWETIDQTDSVLSN